MKNNFKKALCVAMAIFMLISLASCGGSGAGRGDTSKNTIDWDSDFFGTTIPNPNEFVKASKFDKKVIDGGNSWAIVEVDGLSYKDFIDYCKSLEALPGWTSEEELAVSNLPATENSEERIKFEGSLPAIDSIMVYYYSSGCSKKDGNPYILMYVYETWS